MDVIPDHQEQRPRKQTRAWKQAASVGLAAVFGSVVTAGVLSYTWNPAKVTPASTTAAAAQTHNAASVAAVQNASATVVNTVQSTASGDPNAIVEQVFKQLEPDVVAVVNYQNQSDFFTQQIQLQEYGVGSGVLFKKDASYAYFVTNNHVVSGENKLEIVLANGTHVTAQLVGADPYTDLAVIKVPVNKVGPVAPAVFADSNSIQVGQLAIAIGTPLGLNFAETCTSGIVSGKSRVMPVQTPDGSSTLDYQSVIQTDAAINPGNSGGPLLNYQGQVVGINSSKIVESATQSMGFAIPSDEVKTVVQEIMTTGHVAHPALGVTAYSLSDMPEQYWPNIPVNYGVYVYGVDSANAKKSGLKQGDVIVQVNGQTVQDEAGLRTDLFSLKPGDVVTLGVYRATKKLTLKLTLGTMSALTSTVQTTAPAAFGSNGQSGNPFGSNSQFGNPFSAMP